MDQNGCPDDFEDLVRNYYGAARRIVRQDPRVPPDDVDDVTQNIMLKVGIEKDVIGRYDPNKVFHTPSGDRTARFASLFKASVRAYLRTPIETLVRKQSREPIRLEQPTATGELWMEVHAPIVEADPADEVSMTTEVERAYRHLATVHLGPDMTADVVLEAMLRIADENGGHLRRKPLAATLGVQDSTATRWIRKVRKELLGIGFMHDPVAA